jgi:hypothetical protein
MNSSRLPRRAETARGVEEDGEERASAEGEDIEKQDGEAAGG